MHDPLPVRLVQGIGHLDPITQYLLELERSLEKPVRQRLALQVLHDQELDAVLVAHVVERADVRMGELGDRLRLPLETLARLDRRRQVRRQHLDRHRAIQARVLRPVDLSHSACANRREKLVRPETGSRGKCGHNPHFPR